MKRIINYKLFLLEKKINELNTDTDIPSIRSNIDIPNLTEDLMRTVKEDGGLTEKTTKLLKDLYNYLKSVKSAYLTTFITLLLSILVSCGNSPLESEKIAKSEIGVEDEISIWKERGLLDFKIGGDGPPDETNGFEIHKVQEGESIEDISKKYKLPYWRYIIIVTNESDLNNKKEPGKITKEYKPEDIKKGMQVKIPKLDGYNIVHKVSPKETLSSISRRYSKYVLPYMTKTGYAAVKEVIKLISKENDIETNSQLIPGQEIHIPIHKDYRGGVSDFDLIRDNEKIENTKILSGDVIKNSYTQQPYKSEICDEIARIDLYKTLIQMGLLDESEVKFGLKAPRKKSKASQSNWRILNMIDQDNEYSVGIIHKRGGFYNICEIKSDGTYEKMDEFEKGINYLDKLINGNSDLSKNGEIIPVVCGVSHSRNPKNTDGKTDHFILIIGSGTYEGRKCYYYLDTFGGVTDIDQIKEENVLVQSDLDPHKFVDRKSTDGKDGPIGDLDTYVLSTVVIYNKHRK